jgi:DNA-binding transcriptional MerR regulator
VELRTIRKMLDQGISLQKVRKTVRYMSEMTVLARPLACCKLVTDGATIFQVCEDEGELIDTLQQGQIAFCIGIDSITSEMQAKITELESDRRCFIQTLLEESERTFPAMGQAG